MPDYHEIKAGTIKNNKEMSTILKAQKRENVGTKAAKIIKREGFIPAIIYGAKESQNVSINLKDFETLYLKTLALTTVAELDIDGKKTKVIAHKIDLDPVTDRPIHVDFFNCDKDSNIKAKTKLNFTGKEKSPGLKRGGFLNVVLRRIDLTCDSASVVPHVIDVDASKLRLGDKLTSKNVPLPTGVQFSTKGETLIASVTGRGKSSEEEVVEATSAEGTEGADAAKEEEKKAE